MLIDFYGQLLAARSLEVLELYYYEDMSLAEIGQELSISRQGVHDRIKQGLKNLLDYEDKLKLTSKFLAQKELIRDVDRLLQEERIAEAKLALKELLASL